MAGSSEHQFALKVARLIRARRDAAGLSQETLGARAGLHRTYIGALERGEKSASLFTLSRIARALRAPLSALIPEDQ